MFRLFRFSQNGQKSRYKPRMTDMNGLPLKEGDLVECFRYDLGRCRLIHDDTGYIYESLADGRRVSWAKMIDARTEMQKVKKIAEDQ